MPHADPENPPTIKELKEMLEKQKEKEANEK